MIVAQNNQKANKNPISAVKLTLRKGFFLLPDTSSTCSGCGVCFISWNILDLLNIFALLLYISRIKLVSLLP